MAGQPETSQTESNVIHIEEYAHSLSKLRAMGAAAVSREADIELLPTAEAQAYADFVSGVREMLRTDQEFRGRLDIDDRREHQVAGGKTRDMDGRALTDIIAGGMRASESAARFRPELEAQAVRDAGDLFTAEQADALRPGEAWIALSMEPKRELQAYPETYKNLGYREGLTYIQWYAKASEDKLVAGSFSVDMSDEAVWRQILADEGVHIAPGESPNTWIRHGMARRLSPEQAEKFVRELRGRYYEAVDATAERHSVSDYLKRHEATVRGLFGAYYPDLAEAVASGQNNDTMRKLASAVLDADLSNMKPAVRSQLMRVANSARFNDELGRTMESVIRYAVVEELRKGLYGLVHPAGAGSDSRPQFVIGPNTAWLQQLSADELSAHLAGNVSAGVRAGRSYGGCAGQVELNEITAAAAGASPQEAFGGRDSREGTGKAKFDTCVVPSCPTRPNKVLVGGCGVCLGRCQKMFDAGRDPTKAIELFKSEQDDEEPEPVKELKNPERPTVDEEDLPEHHAGRLALAAA